LTPAQGVSIVRGFAEVEMVNDLKRLIVSVLFVCFSGTGALAQAHWVGSWASSQQLVEPQNSIPADDVHDLTLRQVAHVSLGGRRIRLMLSNRYGTSPLHVDAVDLAIASSPASDRIVPGSDKAMTFSGSQEVTIPAGADYVSDALAISVPAFSDLAITMHFQEVPAAQTGHPGSRATSYLAHGVAVSAPELTGAKKIDHWYFLGGVEVETTTPSSAVVALGDSITDGHGATTNGNDRWPDVLARRFEQSATTRHLAVLNHGIGGNRLLLDGTGPNALARFNHDVISQTGARYLIVLEGINDLGTFARTEEKTEAEHNALVAQLQAAYEQMITRAHAHGFRMFGATILPFAGSGYYHPNARTEKDRELVNEWIRAKGHFDAVIDLDQVTRDPENPERLLPQYDSGDHLHPSPAGYAAMANAIPLTLFSAPQAQHKSAH